MLGVYKHQLVGPVPQFPREIEEGIDVYLAQAAAEAALADPEAPVLPASATPAGVLPSVVSPPSDQPLSFPAAPRVTPANREQSTSRPGGES
jgi:hypothetical protein